MNNRILTIMRMPIFEFDEDKYCIVCFKKLKDNAEGLLCDIDLHFETHDDYYKMLNSIAKKWGIIFPLEDKRMIDFFGEDLKHIYLEAIK